MASRPTSGSAIEIEAGDDFVLGDQTTLTSATFTGLLPSSAPLSSIQQVRVKAYRVFPVDSDVTRTSGPPVYSTSAVPTRLDSPADVAFAQGDSADGSLAFTVSALGPFTGAELRAERDQPQAEPDHRREGSRQRRGGRLQHDLQSPPQAGGGPLLLRAAGRALLGRLLLVVGGRGVVSLRINRLPGVDPQRQSRTGLAAGRNRHRRRCDATQVQCRLLSCGDPLPDRSPLRPRASRPRPPAALTPLRSPPPVASLGTASPRAGRCRAACPHDRPGRSQELRRRPAHSRSRSPPSTRTVARDGRT